MDKNDNESGMFIKASRKLDHYLLKPTLERLLNTGTYIGTRTIGTLSLNPPIQLVLRH